jgi:hypothetical protein
MTLRAALLGIVLAALSAPPSGAGTRCVFGEGGEYLVFRGVKRFHPGRAVALAGSYTLNGQTFLPVHGAAVQSGDGTIRVGVQVHGLFSLGQVYDDAIFNMSVDSGFSGTGTINLSGDFGAMLPPYNWTALPCRSLPNP